jgi:hypothetical protein
VRLCCICNADTIRTIENYADCIVLRHFQAGSVKRVIGLLWLLVSHVAMQTPSTRLRTTQVASCCVTSTTSCTPTRITAVCAFALCYADTIRTIENYADCIVLRHFQAGSAKRAALVSSVPIINAGGLIVIFKKIVIRRIATDSDLGTTRSAQPNAQRWCPVHPSSTQVGCPGLDTCQVHSSRGCLLFLPSLTPARGHAQAPGLSSKRQLLFRVTR